MIPDIRAIVDSMKLFYLILTNRGAVSEYNFTTIPVACHDRPWT